MRRAKPHRPGRGFHGARGVGAVAGKADGMWSVAVPPKGFRGWAAFAAERPWTAIAAGCAATAASVIATIELGGVGVSFNGGGLLAAAATAGGGILPGGAASVGLAAVALAAVVAASIGTSAGGNSWPWAAEHASEEDGAIARGDPAKPFLPTAAASSPPSRASRILASTEEGGEEDNASSPTASAANTDEEAPREERLKRRDPFRGQRRDLLQAAQKQIRAWAAALALDGVPVVVGGEPRMLRLEPPKWKNLLLTGVHASPAADHEDRQDEEENEEGDEAQGQRQDGDREEQLQGRSVEVEEVRLPLVGISMKLEGSTLTLVSGFGSGQRRLPIEMVSFDDAVELAVTIKALRGSTDNGCGIFDWHERGPDIVERPAPVE
mmetsp:Transcript_4066/g.10811  ORF Transcript_4066/g.10811 Transcript_4066/m.10811 type:complete len:381 (-) Transcript_4066:79-1221(-)